MSIFIQSYIIHNWHKACNSAGLQIVPLLASSTFITPYFHYDFMSFKLGHVSIPKRRIFLPPFLFCAYDSSVLQNFKIFTHLLPNFSYKDSRLTEVTYHCINFNDRVRKVPKISGVTSLPPTTTSRPSLGGENQI